MFDEKEIREWISGWFYTVFAKDTVKPESMEHFLFILNSIQNEMIYNYGSSGFIGACVEKDWEKAYHYADDFNKQGMTAGSRDINMMNPHNNIFEGWVEYVHKSPELRERRLSTVLDKDENEQEQ